MTTCIDEKQIISELKRKIVKLASKNGVGHIPSCFSSLDILYTLYSKIVNITPQNVNSISRDKVIVSKEHCKPALLFVLEHFGLIPEGIIDSWSCNGGLCGHDIFAETGNPDLAAVDVSYGSLGQGIGVGLGLAIANPDNNIYVIAGDGELQEGSCWEAFMYIGHHKIKNITVIIDRNFIQGGDYTKNIIDTSSHITEQISSFQFDVIEIDGHNHEETEKALRAETEKPKCIVANTVKGKECLFIAENKGFGYLHNHTYTKEEFNKILEEIG